MGAGISVNACKSRFSSVNPVSLRCEREAGELGFEPRLVVFRWHSPRIAFTSQAIETPKVKRKPRFDYIVRMWRSRGQYCPQFAPICHRSGATEISILAGLLLSFLNEWGVPTGMLANIPALATRRLSSMVNVISPSRKEALFLPAVNVRGWPAAWRHDGFPQGVLAAHVFAG